MRVPERVRRLGGVIDALPERWFLGAVLVGQWALLASFAALVRHDGWRYGGADPGRSLVEGPLADLAGASLTPIVLVQALVFVPLGALAVYGIAKRIGGTLLARVAVLGWVTAPYAVIPLFNEGYRGRYTEQFLPNALGLTGSDEYPSMILLLGAAYLFFRHVEDAKWESAALSALVGGLAIGVQASNALFLVAPFLCLLVMQRRTGAVAFSLALVPAVLMLAVWQQRSLPDWSLSSLPTALLTHELASIAGGARPTGLDLNRLTDNLIQFREQFWSRRLVEWLPFAGALGAIRCFPLGGLFLCAWLAPFALLKGAAGPEPAELGSFLHYFLPAWPAYFLLGVSVLALVPEFGRRFGPTASPSLRTSSTGP